MKTSKYKSLSSLMSILGAATIGKLLSMLARLLTVRTIKSEAMGIFSLINPLMVLLINLSQIGLPVAISTLIAKKPNDSRKIYVTAFIIGILLSILIMLLIFFLAPIFAKFCLKNESTTLAIYGLGLLIPLTTTSSIIKRIYIGKRKVQYTTNSSIVEEIFRLSFLLFAIGYFSKQGPEMGALGAVIGMAFGEVGQTLYLYFIASKNTKKNCLSWLFDKNYESKYAAKELLKISLPATASKIIGSVAYFFEPIIFTNMVYKLNLDMNSLVIEYGILTSYVFPILVLPSYFIIAISNYFLPDLAKSIETRDYQTGYLIFLKLISTSLGLGIIFTNIIFFGSDFLFNTLYKTTKGAEYLKVLSFPFLIFYIETPCIISLHALSRSNKTILSTIISSLIRLFLLFFSIKYLSIYAVAISTLVGAYIDILLNLVDIISFFKRNNVQSIFKIQYKKKFANIYKS